ncbi:hypothetical protein HMPREF9318_00735 [Streptococcus urinalis FB127-CNA-2]|uniref:DUF4430 domain-containing protein n=1 Tax=Streptococcus urinalis TaxID=149016 RepID=UPI000225C62D|nr:DUF4430 domain-containing protein [Streptococcus urinalis]EKS22537.1 hypothetical protein HMPREF9318_00735 [Streptococcus urinalis FB127-CNA-2]VEF32350.1 putative lipoprotein [Streptococcus urinalis]
MKKYIKLLLIVSLFLFLSACSHSSHSKSSNQNTRPKVRLILKKDKSVLDKKVTFKKGQTVMAVLKKHYKVVENNGFITEIDGLKQDQVAKKYWMFDINGKVAPKAANQIKVKSGDVITFYQKVYK